MKNYVIVGLFLGWSSTLAVASEVGRSTVSELDWLAGCWQGSSGEECWLAENNGTMIGINRSPDGHRFELLRIVTDEEHELTYLASPQGRCPATPFRLAAIEGQRVVFTNPEHDFPQRIEYWLDDDRVLHARVSATTDGVEDGFEISWRRSRWSDRDGQQP